MKTSDIERVFCPDEPLFDKGSRGRQLYVVSSGEVRLEPEGRLVGPGGILGEISALTGWPEPRGAVADSDVTVLALDLPVLQKLCVECPEFSLRLIRHLAERLAGQGLEVPAAISQGLDEPESEAAEARSDAPATVLVARAILAHAAEGEGPEPVAGRLRELAAACSLDLRATYLEIQSLLESRVVRLAEGELQLVDRQGLETIAASS